MKVLAKVFFVLLFIVSYANGAKILGVFPLPWGSHYILGTKLLRGLAEAGHNITMITPYKYKEIPKNGSWTDVLIADDDGKFPLPSQENLFNEDKMNGPQKFYFYLNSLLSVTNVTLTHPKVQNLIKSQATFDVVIVENLMSEAQFVLAHIFKCPLILLSSIGPNLLINEKVGNPSPAATITEFSMQPKNPDEFTVLERFRNIFQKSLGYIFIHLVQFSKNNKILHEIFPDAPHIYDLNYNVSLVLLNSHPSTTGPVPLVPNMIEVGGYYVDPPKKLPNDLQQFLDSAENGAIYFSMGSQLKSENMSQENKQMFLNVFRKLKQKVLWKFQDDLPGKSDNVLIRGWMPQQDILAHPNVKLFISQGGLLSATETIYHGVPLLVIPVFGDQTVNAARTVKSGCGLSLPYAELSEEKLANLIQELLTNERYQKTVQEKSKIFKDRPMTPLETAVYWIEYVVRHKGAPHLRVPGIKISWYKYYNFNVYGIILLVVYLGLIVLRYISNFLLSIIRCRRNQAKLKMN